jgi:hypothetical protein
MKARISNVCWLALAVMSPAFNVAFDFRTNVTVLVPTSILEKKSPSEAKIHLGMLAEELKDSYNAVGHRNDALCDPLGRVIDDVKILKCGSKFLETPFLEDGKGTETEGQDIIGPVAGIPENRQRKIMSLAEFDPLPIFWDDYGRNVTDIVIEVEGSCVSASPRSEHKRNKTANRIHQNHVIMLLPLLERMSSQHGKLSVKWMSMWCLRAATNSTSCHRRCFMMTNTTIAAASVDLTTHSFAQAFGSCSRMTVSLDHRRKAKCSNE